MTEHAKVESAAEEAEAVRLRRLREDAQRPISVNLAETIALSHQIGGLAVGAWGVVRGTKDVDRAR
ncbi:MAG TPA: hypothetical protein VHI77_11840 [Solirubrobacterales bacterium]|jgi:hypothetical protein|nr:hypothetical protein [Solirubrobacterales bacterium]